MKPTQDDMERAARIDIGRCACSYHYLCGVHTPIAQAIADARESEREACAKVCESLVSGIYCDSKCHAKGCIECAAAIRARAAEREGK